MSLTEIRNKNKKDDSFACSKIDLSNLSPEDVKEIKEEIFNKIVKPINYNIKI